MPSNHQYRAGYILESVQKWLKQKLDGNNIEKEKVQGLLNLLTTFEAKSDVELEKIKDPADPVLFVLHNLIIRGMPTWISYELEKEFANQINLLKPYEKYGSEGFGLEAEETWTEKLIRAMHLIEPRINRQTAYENYLNSWEEHGSSYEERYLYEEAPKWIDQNNGDLFIQLMEPQRLLTNMVTIPQPLGEMNQNFTEQRADFVIEYPYPLRDNGKRGICIEIDGPQHLEENQKHLDKKRDDALFESGWAKTLRLKTSDFNDQGFARHFESHNRLLETDYYRILKENYSNPLFKNEDGLIALQLALSPIAIARIHLSMVRAILCGLLSLNAEKWRIAIVERDVHCGNLAIQDFRRILQKLLDLEGKDRKVPEIEITVYNTPEFDRASLKSNENTMVLEYAELDDSYYDLYIDISVLERRGLSRRSIDLNFDHYIEIRSAYSTQAQPVFLTTSMINWRPLFKTKDIDHKQPLADGEEPLKFFLQNIFRKKEFRPGQLPILNRALQNKTVVGLLPTGGGKSLTYQLAGLLQPGHTIVIDPIKSLMKDQVDGLARMGITGTVFINSSLKTLEDREKAMKKVSSGQALFCFVSPERLMIPSFRNILVKMFEENRFFVYGVIDEVHCVSEWGHDFRTPYLSLGRNLLDHCKSNDGEIALFGLTATASYDVLSDVQRELSGNRPDRFIPDEAIVRHETTNRDELQMQVYQVKISDETIDRIARENKPEWFELAIKKAIGVAKQEMINDLLEKAPDILKNFNDNPDEILNEDLIKLTYNSGDLPSVAQIYKDLKLPSGLLEEDFWSKNNKDCDYINAGLVFAPHRTWYFGVTDRYVNNPERNNGIFENILRGFPDLKAKTFMGVDHEDEQISKHIEDDNLKHQNEFTDHKINLMIATKAFGMGIDKPNIRFTIHASYPSSIESFVQEAGRAGRDRKLAVSTIVYNDQVIENRAEPETFIETDYDIQLDFYNKSFKGEEKEKAIIYELLTEVTHPRRSRTYDLAVRLNQKDEALSRNILFSVRFSKGVYNGFEYANLFLNDSDRNNYGYLRVRTGQKKLDRINTDPYIADYFLGQLWDLIREIGPVDDQEALEEWLAEDNPVDPTPGIERILSEINFGDPYSIVISFRNDEHKVYHRLANHLLPIDERFKPELCQEHFEPKIDTFLEKIFSEVNVNDYREKIEIHFQGNEERINTFYKHIGYALNSKRDKSDTEKAIYRLSLIGVIDDYTIDYNAETYTIKGKKKTNDEYHEHLRNYISKYYSKRRTDAIIKGLPDRRGDTEIQRILNFTIGFVYEEVAKKRRLAIEAMKTCCQVGLEKGNVEMKTWIHLYFNSKYARKGYTVEFSDELMQKFRALKFKLVVGETGIYNASLLDWSEEGKESDFDWIIDFMHITQYDSSNSQRDNLKHLRGACTRLLIGNPDNYVFRLLRAFSLIILDEDHFKERQIQMVSEDLESGFQSLWDFNRGNQKQFYMYLREYQKNVKEQISNPNVEKGFDDHMEKIMFISHVQWTKQFSEEYATDLTTIDHE